MRRDNAGHIPAPLGGGEHGVLERDTQWREVEGLIIPAEGRMGQITH